MKDYLSLRGFLVVALLTICSAASASATGKPNIVYLMLDDAGYGDFGAFGSKEIQTPVFDRMCREGTRYTNHYAGSAVCAPTRCVLMTGLHTGHCRRRDNTAKGSLKEFGRNRPLVFLENEDVTVAESLKEAGYVTGGIGKWGIGNVGSNGVPEKQGFDHWFGYYDQVHAHDHYSDYLIRDGKREEIPENVNGKRGTYVHDLFENEMLEFVRRNKADPFFLYLAMTLPHGKYEVPHNDPAYKIYADRPWAQSTRNYAAMVTRADRSAGALLNLLKELNLDSNTIVFYTSDNGPNRQFLKDLDSGGGLRGIKRQLYEGGLRAPMAVRWPGHVPVGRTSEFVWSMVDIFPTACELAGAAVPGHLDGSSVLPELLGKMQRALPPLYWEIHSPFQQAVRVEHWKGIRFGTKEPLEVYDLEADPGEERDIAGSNPEMVAKIEAIMAKSRTENRFFPAIEMRKKKR